MPTVWMNEIRHLAEKERRRNHNARPYVGLAYLDSPSRKQCGSPIIGTDTIKGCNNGCFRCYANRISRIHRKVFSEPVRCFVAGIPDAGIVYRFGTFGDPAIDWDWTFREIERLQARGMRRFYLVSKLQSVEGFRNHPDLCLHVSFDPLNPSQLGVTMRNFDSIETRTVVRLKSLRSGLPELMKRQEEAIEFAQSRNAPLLETRFYTPVKTDLTLLRLEEYTRKGGLFKYPGSVFRDCFGLNSHKVCDRSNTGLCRDCLNCLTYLP